MGIPSFYRWLVNRYPLAVEDVIEDSPEFINGVEVPIDSSQPNPNEVEFDNLYLDMNGIIHPCFHPEGHEPPTSYDEVFKNVFRYIDRLFSIIRPRKLLYMAIDGVAPRAKMNQQRSRRFKAAKEAAAAAAVEEILGDVGESGAALPANSLDSNVITPGTEFMAELSSALRYYIHLRMNTDPGWSGIKVILSDANVVGEGEHKIVSYIRLQRNLPGFDPNTRHCMYGLDADLIMLALATHEIHFSILREDVSNVRRNTSKTGNGSRFNCWGNGNQKLKLEKVGLEDYISKQKFQFFNVWVLREYLALEMKIPNQMVKTDLERLLDDFVFMCLLVGNDFLPHLPSLEISEGAIDLLMTVYKKEFVQMGGYLTESFKVNLKRVEHFLQALAVHESAIFRRRKQVQKEREIFFRKVKVGDQSKRTRKKHSDTFWSCIDRTLDSTNPSSSTFGAKEIQSHRNSATPDGSNATVDNIRLGEEGWKERFYAEKFEARNEEEREKIRKHAVLKYIEGMCWVMHYYYEGVCSWQWFYPYHYAPFASDFYDIEHSDIHFTPGKPFKPLDQLMAVLPAASAHALPSCYRELMTDPSSPILEFYPNDFEIDLNGKRFEWQAICKLPFIKESKLLAEIAKVEHTLTDEERCRNKSGMDMLFLHSSHPLEAKVTIFYQRNKDHPKLAKGKVKREIDPKFSGGMNGFIYLSDRPICLPEICSSISDLEKITTNKVISVFYKYPTSHPHVPRPPEGTNIPKKLVKKADIMLVPMLWHESLAVLGPVRSQRPVPKSISGSYLAKIAHQLILEYYAVEIKENMDGAIQNGSDTAVTRNPQKRTNQAIGEVSVPGHIASTPCQAVQIAKEQVHEKTMYGTSCPNMTETEMSVPDTAVTKTPEKRKLKRKAGVVEKQETGEESVTRDMVLNIPSCQTKQGSEEQVNENKVYSMSSNVAEPDKKAPDTVVTKVQMMYGTSCPNMTEIEKSVPDTAVTKTPKKRKLKRKAGVVEKQEIREESVPRDMVLNTPSCQTEEQVNENKMYSMSSNVAEPDKKAPDTVVTKVQTMYSTSCPNMTETEKSIPDTAVTKTPKKRKLKRKAGVLEKQEAGEESVPRDIVLNIPSCQTKQGSEEQVNENKMSSMSSNVAEPDKKAPDTVTRSAKKRKCKQNADIEASVACKRKAKKGAVHDGATDIKATSFASEPDLIESS